jgi:hypothetical protein
LNVKRLLGALYSIPVVVPYGKDQIVTLSLYPLHGCFAVAGGGGKTAVKRQDFLIKQGTLMLNNTAPQKWQRLKAKQLDQQFISEICTGCCCSPFEAQAILETVNKVYGAFFDNSATIQQGQIQLSIISSEARINTRLAEAALVTVTLTLNDDSEDLDIRQKQGIIALRQHRLQRICIEAVQQGGLLTVEDLANRLLNCGERTLCRDIKELKAKGIILPLRSTLKDMGRSISHRSDIVRHWLLGKEYTQIGRDTHHSVQSVYNYVDKFKRVVSLAHEEFDIFTIAFLVRISSQLVEEYLNFFNSFDIVPHRKQELINLANNTSNASLSKPKKTIPLNLLNQITTC